MSSRQAGQSLQSRNAFSSTTKSATLQKNAEQRDRLLDEYFESTKLLHVIQHFTSNLAATFKADLRLPANPYPELLKTVRMHELRQASVLQSNNSSNISAALELIVLGGQASSPPQFQVCSVEHEQFALPIWGYKSTLEQLTGANLYGLLKQLNTASQGLLVTYKEFTDDECQATAYGVLVGNSIFGARLQDLQPCFLELEAHVFVSGLHLEKTMAVFARFLIKQLLEATNAAKEFASFPAEEVRAYRGCILCDGVTITSNAPASTEFSAQPEAPSVWTIDRVLENRVAFTNAIKSALVSASLITLNRYDATLDIDVGGIYLCQVEQVYFFHFTMADGKKALSDAKDAISRRSFFLGSRATLGIFFDSNGALEIAARFRAEAENALAEERKKQLQKKKQTTFSEATSVVAVSKAKQRSGFVGLLQGVIGSLRQIGLENEAFRQQTNFLVGCFAYNMGHLVGAHQVLESVLYRCGSAAIAAMIPAMFGGLEVRMKVLLEEVGVFPQTSMLHPTCSLLRHFYSQVQADSALNVGAFVESLQCVDELLLLVVRAAFSDFLRLVRATVALPKVTASLKSTSETQLENNFIGMEEVDVLRALEMAIEDRKYPAAIVSEALLAQVMIDSCLDVALESAVMNTVATCLPPNPFIDMSGHLQVFALRQLVWKQSFKFPSSNNITTIAKSGSHELFLFEETNICTFNPSLIKCISHHAIVQAHEWLLDHHILYESTYKPSKSSYSAAIFPMVLVFHPLDFAQARRGEDTVLLKELYVVEHYVIEGKELAHARFFFVEATCGDLRRIVTMRPSLKGNNCWKLLVEVCVVDSHGKMVTEINLSSLTTDELLVAALDEATQKQFSVTIIIQIAEMQNQDSTSIMLHKVTKTYVFHHHSTDEQDNAPLSALFPPLISFRVSKYGVFLSKQHAQLCLKIMASSVYGSQESKIPRDEWTPYASQALQQGDSLLIYELSVVNEIPSLSNPQTRRKNELFTRILVHSDACRLYSLEQAVRWLLDAVLSRLYPPTAPYSRNEDLFTGLPPATLFNIHHLFVRRVIDQLEQLVGPLNDHLQFVHQLPGCIDAFRKCITRWEGVQPPTEEQLEIYCKQREKAPNVLLFTPREDPITITIELVDSLRSMWVLLLFFRFSYQRALFANADSNREETREYSDLC